MGIPAQPFQGDGLQQVFDLIGIGPKRSMSSAAKASISCSSTSEETRR